MKRRFDPIALVGGLAALGIGAMGLLGLLDLRTIAQSWLVPGAVVILGVGVLAGAVQQRRG